MIQMADDFQEKRFGDRNIARDFGISHNLNLFKSFKRFLPLLSVFFLFLLSLFLLVDIFSLLSFRFLFFWRVCVGKKSIRCLKVCEENKCSTTEAALRWLLHHSHVLTFSLSLSLSFSFSLSFPLLFKSFLWVWFWRFLHLSLKLSGELEDGLILGGSSISHMQENIKAIEGGPLPGLIPLWIHTYAQDRGDGEWWGIDWIKIVEAILEAMEEAWKTSHADCPKYFRWNDVMWCVEGISVLRE